LAPIFLGAVVRSLGREQIKQNYFFYFSETLRHQISRSGFDEAYQNNSNRYRQPRVDGSKLKLAQRGFYRDTSDGQLGGQTREALRGFQASIGTPADGFASADMPQRLRGQ
jgi:peptidoglycan hydrolase-like protein with peptidoglycan-binding domain